MTVKEFYEACGGGYETMVSKFASDSMITKFLEIFKRDRSFETLCAKLDEGDTEGAFNAAHTLKGVVLNLNLVGLIDPVCNVVEALRAGNIDAARSLFPKVKEAFARTEDALKRILP